MPILLNSTHPLKNRLNLDVAFVNMTGYKGIVPISLKSHQPIDLHPKIQYEILNTIHFWSCYFIAAYFNDKQEPQITYINFGFKPNSVKFHDVMDLTNSVKDSFIDKHQHLMINRIVWIGIPNNIVLSDDQLFDLTTIYGGFKLRG